MDCVTRLGLAAGLGQGTGGEVVLRVADADATHAASLTAVGAHANLSPSRHMSALADDGVSLAGRTAAHGEQVDCNWCSSPLEALDLEAELADAWLAADSLDALLAEVGDLEVALAGAWRAAYSLSALLTSAV
jgi:hypothetical protein